MAVNVEVKGLTVIQHTKLICCHLLASRDRGFLEDHDIEQVRVS